MKIYLQMLAFLLISYCYADDTWMYHYQKGYEHFFDFQYEEASSEFDRAIQSLSEEEKNHYPYLFVYRAESNYFLQNYEQVLQDTEKALNSNYLTENERLTCGMRRIAVFVHIGDESASIEEYKKYIIGCPLFPQYDYSKETAIVRNIPDCQFCKESTRQLMISEFCASENDISEYDDMWIINITKNFNCSSRNKKNTRSSISITKRAQRGPAEAQACCNTVNKLAVAANVICGCVSTPFGPISSITCKVACAVFVEGIRQASEWCCNNGGVEEKC